MQAYDAILTSEHVDLQSLSKNRGLLGNIFQHRTEKANSKININGV